MAMFWYLRVILFYFSISFTTTFFFLLLVLSHFLGASYDRKYAVAKLYSEVFIWLAEVICGLRYRVLGLEKMPEGPAVFVGNHQSFWENVFVQLIVPKHSWIIKKEILDMPVFGLGVRIMEPIAVDRSESVSVKKILKEGQKKLQDGLWMIVFPESTRILPHEYKKFKPSAVKLAMMSKVPIVMMAHNAGLFWPKDVLVRKPGIITVEILSVLTPVDYENADVREVTDRVEQAINDAKDRLARGV